VERSESRSKLTKAQNFIKTFIVENESSAAAAVVEKSSLTQCRSEHFMKCIEVGINNEPSPFVAERTGLAIEVKG